MTQQFYFKQFNLAQVKIKWFQVLLFNSNNSIEHLSFIYTQLNYQTILFQAIKVSVSHLFS